MSARSARAPSAPLRIAVVSRATAPLHGHGGLERHVYDLTRWLLRRGHRVSLITRPRTATDEAGGSDDLAHANLDITFVPYRTFPLAGRRGTTILDRSTAYPAFGLRAGRAAFALVDAGRIDIVHGLGASVLGYARARSRDASARAPLVFNPQGMEEFGSGDARWGGARFKRFGYLPLQRAVRACAAAADRVIATDHAIRPIVLQHLHAPPERVVVIPNAIDLERCDRLAPSGARESRRGSIGLAADEPLLVSVGRLEANKGFQVLAAALGRMRDARWRWALVGDGPYRSRIEHAVQRAGIADRVRLVGRVSDADLHGWYEAADLFVHPTLYEGSSLTTLEAMAHKRPVVGARAGGLPDKVLPGSTGWLVTPGCDEELSRALTEALATPLDRREAMGEAGRRLVEAEFSWGPVVDRTIALYDELLVRSNRT